MKNKPKRPAAYFFEIEALLSYLRTEAAEAIRDVGDDPEARALLEEANATVERLRSKCEKLLAERGWC
jgi:hypothetical protein